MVSIFGEKISNAVSEYLASVEYKPVFLTSCDNNAISSNLFDFAPKASSAMKSTALIRITTNAYSSPSIYGIVSVSKVEDNYPKFLSSFQVDQNEFEQQLVNGISTCLVSSGTWGPSFPTLLQMDELRRVFLLHLLPRDLAVLSCVSKSINNISKKRDVDETFWKQHLKKDFNMKADRFCNRKAYYDEAKARKKKAMDEQSSSQQSRLLVQQPDPTFPRPGPFFPDPRRPDGPFFPDPLNPNMPFVPDPFGGGRHPAPWDPSNSEMMPSRAPRNVGPRQMGGNNNPFGYYGNNDFI